jgi:hypothetical protein
MNDQQQMMQQLLAYLEKQMEGSQQNMADLPQRALQAGATPTQGSGGTILSPDPVRRVQQANEAWRERFPNPVENAARLGMTPEALLASRGNDATNQWAQLGGVVGVDPQKQRDMNRAASQYAAFAKSQREGTNGVTSEIPSSEYVPGASYRSGQSGTGSVAADGTRTVTSPYGTASMGPQNPQVAAAPAPQAPVTAGVPAGDLFGGAMATAQQVPAMVGNAVNAAQDWWQQNVIPDAPVNTERAPDTQGSPFRQGALKALNFIPNAILGLGGKVAEAGQALFGNQVDVPDVNFNSDFFSNLGVRMNQFPAIGSGTSASVSDITGSRTSDPGLPGETIGQRNSRVNEANRQYGNAFQQVRGQDLFDTISGANQDEQRDALIKTQMERNANPAAFTAIPQQPVPQMQLGQPQPQSQLPAFAFPSGSGMFTPPPVSTIAVEDPRKRKQPMVAGTY